jgi:hypothetical protein
MLPTAVKTRTVYADCMETRGEYVTRHTALSPLAAMSYAISDCDPFQKWKRVSLSDAGITVRLVQS